MEHIEDTIFQAILDKNNRVIADCIANGATAVSRSLGREMVLHFACLNSNLDALQLLKATLKEGDIDTINIEEDDTICGTALHMSMDGQVDTEVVKLLLDWGADPNARNAKGSSVLHELIYRAWEDFQEDFQSEESMWEDEDSDSLVSDADNDNETGNSKFCDEMDDSKGCSYFRKLSLLVRHGVNINILHSGTKMTPLIFWCQNFNWCMESCVETEILHWCSEFLQLMLENGADPNILNERGETPLHYLSQRHYKPQHVRFMNSFREMLKRIVPKLIDVNQQNIYGRTLLQCAVEHSNIVFIRMLMEFFQDLNVNNQDHFGLSALHQITHKLNPDEMDFVQEMLNALVSTATNVNIQDNHGLTPLHHAVQLSNHAATTALLQASAQIDVKDKQGRTAVDVARILRNGASLTVLDFISTTGMNLDSTDLDRSGQEKITGCLITDISCGRYFPLCCHKMYNQKDAQSDQTEKVLDSDIEEWLKTYPMCLHNKTLVLQNAISALETNTDQAKLDSIDTRSMMKEIYELALRVTETVRSLNPMFEARVIFGGSVSEETKIGACDEFDLVFDLWKLRDCCNVVECTDDETRGFARLKVSNRDELVKYELSHLIDKDGCLSRINTSNEFHRLLEKALNVKDVWGGTNYFSFWGTTNSEGECSNIGQLKLVWYGPWCVRQDVSVDIAPVIRVSGWQSVHCNSNVQIVNQNCVESIGCYLVMKDPLRYVGETLELGEEDANVMNERNLYFESLFKISVSQVEHATMRFLPPEIKMGYKIAKSIQLQCPKILFRISDIFIDSLPCGAIDIDDKAGKGGLRGIIHVTEYLTSYVLKTGLFHELHDQGLLVSFSDMDLHPDNWNRTIIDGAASRLNEVTKAEVTEAVTWAGRIYKRLLLLLQEQETIPEYFLPKMAATKVTGETGSVVKITSTFLKVLIYLLDNFEVPDDLCDDKEKLCGT